MNDQEIKKLEEKVQDCVEKYEHLKVNLTRDESGTNGEGIWATPCSAEDKDIYDNGKAGDKFKVHLCNAPFSWAGVKWGSTIVATNNGDSRPYARLSDNGVANHDEFTEHKVKKQVFENSQV